MHGEQEDATLGGELRSQARAHPHQVAIRYRASSISYAELDQHVDRAAALLQRRGIQRGDRIALLLPNVPEVLILDFACFRLGAVSVPVNTRYRRPEIIYALAHSGARLLIAHAASRSLVQGLVGTISSLEQIWFHVATEGYGEGPSGEDLASLLSAQSKAPVPDAASASDPAVIFYTSGSTGRPKGVVHSHRSLLGAARCQQSTRDMQPGQRWLVATGLGYVAGLAGLSLPCLISGATVLIEEDRDPKTLLLAVEREQASGTLILPTSLLDMLECPAAEHLDLSSLRQVFVGGDECSDALYARFRARFGYDLAQVLGMTECEGFLSNRSDGRNRPGSIGLPADGVSIRLIGNDGTDIRGPGVGEIQVRAPGMMEGYWKNSAASAETLADGWLRSGDIARRDAEGYYWFVERQREIVIRDGSNISPHEVENVIDSHPGVARSCVVGVTDPHHGAILQAFVEREPEAAALSGESLRQWLSSRLAAYKIPDRWDVVDELPRTATGKLDRKGLHQRAALEQTQSQ
ncbi:hypothetical protein EVJ50_02290 [Synechococcus sp. RSCCF101]|uniref:class I adenylate-forming enzyme family protein n=1 Tax=Synechococcus sp. RSCCF101 TaxID=2511069 RepID=UPI0012483C55|nr:AMP-binding protein [Synechococcus sp. RSCCF101]QEY31249.1 hypothetical protein EVJ50_02290 [Synechococcus sp. RSCCF101]